MAVSLDAMKRRMLNPQGDPNDQANFQSAQTPDSGVSSLGTSAPTGGLAQNIINPNTPVGSSADAQNNMNYKSPSVGYDQIPQWQTQGVNDFDFNRQYEDQKNQLGHNLANSTQQYDLANQQADEGYNRQVHDLQGQWNQQLDQNNDRFANNGILHSGIAVQGAGNIGNDIQGKIDSYTQQHTADRTARESQYAQHQQQINDMLAQYQAEATHRQQGLEQDRAMQAAKAQADQEAAGKAQAAMPAYYPGGSFGQDAVQQHQQAPGDISYGHWTGDQFQGGMANVNGQLTPAAGVAQGGYNYGVPVGEGGDQSAMVAQFLQSLFNRGQ